MKTMKQMMVMIPAMMAKRKKENTNIRTITKTYYKDMISKYK